MKLTDPQRRLLRELARPGFHASANSGSGADLRDAGGMWQSSAFGPTLAALVDRGYVAHAYEHTRTTTFRRWTITPAGREYLEKVRG